MPNKWEVEYTDELGEWWADLTEAEQESIDSSVRLLEEEGPNLGFPHTSGIERSKHTHMRELRVQHEGRPLAAAPSSCWVATRQAMTVGTTCMCQ